MTVTTEPNYEEYPNRKAVLDRYMLLTEDHKVFCAIRTYTMMEVVSDMPDRQKFWRHFEKNISEYEQLEGRQQSLPLQQPTDTWIDRVQRIQEGQTGKNLTRVK